MIYLILSSIVDREIIDKVSPHFSPHFSPHSPHLSPYPSSGKNNIEQLQLILANDTTMSNMCPSLRLTEERVHHSPENKATDRESKPSAEALILSCVRTF